MSQPSRYRDASGRGRLSCLPFSRPLTGGDEDEAVKRLPLMGKFSRHRHRYDAGMSANEIDAYLDALEEPKRTTLALLRDTIMAIVPDAEQGISYGMPAFKLQGRTIAGFAAFKNHLSYLPHSGSVIPQLAKETEGYASTKGSLHFPIDKPLPKTLVRKLLTVRMEEGSGG